MRDFQLCLVSLNLGKNHPGDLDHSRSTGSRYPHLKGGLPWLRLLATQVGGLGGQQHVAEKD